MIKISCRNPYTRIVNGEVIEKFDPFFRWNIFDGFAQFYVRGNYGFSVLWKYRVGCWSRIKEKYFSIGRFTFILMLGECAPYNRKQERSTDDPQRQP